MLDYSQLDALLAVDNEGTIEGAARALRVSSFAVSQRISLLEKSVGVTLMERGPTRTSDVGKILCNHARQVIDLEEELIASHQNGTFLDGQDLPPIFRITLTEEAINGWFRKVINEIQHIDDHTRIDITITNPERSQKLMQSGEVVAGISTSKNPIHGFKVYSLGTARYVAMASAAFFERYFANGVTFEAFSTAPCFRYCHNDRLPTQWVEKLFQKPPVIPLTKLPDMHGSLARVLSGEAWAMIDENEAGEMIKEGQLVELLPGTVLSQSLYWHVSIAMLDTMSELTKSVRNFAR